MGPWAPGRSASGVVTGGWTGWVREGCDSYWSAGNCWTDVLRFAQMGQLKFLQRRWDLHRWDILEVSKQPESVSAKVEGR